MTVQCSLNTRSLSIMAVTVLAALSMKMQSTEEGDKSRKGAERWDWTSDVFTNWDDSSRRDTGSGSDSLSGIWVMSPPPPPPPPLRDPDPGAGYYCRRERLLQQISAGSGRATAAAVAGLVPSCVSVSGAAVQRDSVGRLCRLRSI